MHVQPGLRSCGRRQAGVIRPTPARGDQGVGPLRSRGPHEKLEVAQLVTAEGERQQILALDPDLDLATDRIREPRNCVQGRRAVKEGEPWKA